jgi:hypothetical protein
MSEIGKHCFTPKSQLVSPAGVLLIKHVVGFEVFGTRRDLPLNQPVILAIRVHIEMHNGSGVLMDPTPAFESDSWLSIMVVKGAKGGP